MRSKPGDSGRPDAPMTSRADLKTEFFPGAIGTRKSIYDVWGDAVNVASRMEMYYLLGGTSA